MIWFFIYGIVAIFWLVLGFAILWGYEPGPFPTAVAFWAAATWMASQANKQWDKR